MSEFNKMTPPKRIQFIDDIDDIFDSFQQHNTLFIVDTDCPHSGGFLEKANRTQKFRNPYRWLMITKPEKNKTSLSLRKIKILHILIDADVLISERHGDAFSLYSPYKLQSNNSEWKIENFGTWTRERCLNNNKEMFSELSMRRKNVQHLPLPTSIVITNNKTKKSLLSLKEPDIDLVAKASFRQLAPLYQFMNATLVLHFTDSWGYPVNGTVNGMMGALANGICEIGGTVIFMRPERLSLADFIAAPIMPTVRFVFRQPSLSQQNNLFFLPFKPVVWGCILGLIFFIFIIALIITKWENSKTEKENSKTDTTIQADSSEIAMMIIGAITQQGSYTELKGTLGRIVMFITLFVFVFLYTSYSANIVALLQSTSNQIKTLADLLNSNLELGCEDTLYNRYYFKMVTDPVKKAIYEQKIAPRGSQPNFMSLHEGILKLQKKPFAFNMFLGSGYAAVEKYFLEHEKCGLQEITYVDEKLPWLTCRKNSHFKEIYKIGFTRILEHGMNSREYRKSFVKKPVCISRGGTFDSVYMRDFYPALLMLAYGMILSVILVLLEILHWRRFKTIQFTL
uniref:Ionotropic receptor 75q1 n=1 Tax=Heliconius melpomene rosina TaxID=171916 RepID=A0A140G9H6_HELME|nr:ionotropic receptor 75q1 [Heliconius melpomene rosina]